MLEAMKHEESVFITLTYSPEYYPSDGSLVPRHLVLFLKRLRERIKPSRIRYYAVGEYGDTTGRAHYHAVIFGLGADAAHQLLDCWDLGHIHVGTLTLDSAAYVCGYMTKKMTKKDDPRLFGRYPEFARMSRKPGIGAGAIDELKDFMNSKVGQLLLESTGDVPRVLAHGGKKMPLGRYLRRKLREAIDLPQPSATSPEMAQYVNEMHALYGFEAHDSKFKKLAKYQASTKSKILSVETRYKIFSSKGKKL